YSIARGGSFFSISFGHVVPAARTNFDAALLAFRIGCLYAQNKFVQAAIVFLAFFEFEAETIASIQVADHPSEAGSVIFHAADMDSFTATLLRQMLGTTGKAESRPADQRLAQRQKEFIERAHVHVQSIEDRILPNQDLFSRAHVLFEDWRDA